jgi:hypothetical protein
MDRASDASHLENLAGDVTEFVSNSFYLNVLFLINQGLKRSGGS